MTTALAMLIALLIDAVIGWPDALYRRIGHPVTWIGALITALESRLNRPPHTARHVEGVAIVLLVPALCALVALAITACLPDGLVGALILGVFAWPLVAARAMYTHVADVARPLEKDDLPAARHTVSMIVGRAPSQLDAPAVARATLESLAENTSDGIVAPVFWGVLFGLPGIAAYKAVNTLDSMIGHRNDRYAAFGWASARLDDLVNLIPARLNGILFVLVSAAPLRALKVMWHDAGRHRSPNAGWPESAMAGALNLRLSGPRIYDTHTADEPWLNAAAPDPTPNDIWAGLRLYLRAMLALAAILGLLAL